MVDVLKDRQEFGRQRRRRIAWILILIVDLGYIAWGAGAAAWPDHLLGPGQRKFCSTPTSRGPSRSHDLGHENSALCEPHRRLIGISYKSRSLCEEYKPMDLKRVDVSILLTSDT